MSAKNLRDRLAAGIGGILARGGVAGTAEVVDRLSGGANMESWLLRAGDAEFILRRAPSEEWLAGRPLNIAGEVAVIRHAGAGGVPAPRIVAELTPADNLGSGFLMSRISGTAAPGEVLRMAKPVLIEEIARAIAAIHALPVEDIGYLPRVDAASGVEELANQFAEMGGDRPIIALGLAWLRANLPPPVPDRVVHGDLRIGNLMVDAGHLTGVIDWELAHLGDPHEDLAYGCMTVWRFDQPERPAFGLSDLATFFSAYEAAGGNAVDPARFRFWLVYRTVWWALGCLEMGQSWRSGSDRSLERVVISRRAGEQELDLLALIEDEAPEIERTRPLPAPLPTMPEPAAGEATAEEILTAVAEWLRANVKPQLTGRDAFDLAVARNALAIAGRQLTQRPPVSDPALAQDILAGRATLATPGLLAALRRRALDTVEADMPKYPALARARADWKG